MCDLRFPTVVIKVDGYGGESYEIHGINDAYGFHFCHPIRFHPKFRYALKNCLQNLFGIEFRIDYFYVGRNKILLYIYTQKVNI